MGVNEAVKKLSLGHVKISIFLQVVLVIVFYSLSFYYNDLKLMNIERKVYAGRIKKEK